MIIHPPIQKKSSAKGSTRPTHYATTTEQKMPPAPPSSGEPRYSRLELVPASCDTTAREWESQYSKPSFDNMETDPTDKEHLMKSRACRKKRKPNGPR